ncbi:MAG: GtrA family protein [Blastococcus sp.]
MPSDDVGSRFGGTWRVLVRELGAFGIVGAACFVLDLALFQLLYGSVGLGAVTAKLVATLVSMTVAFLGHRYWSFAHRQRTGLRQGYVRFALINAVTLTLGLAIIAAVRYPLGQESVLALQLANIVAIAVGTLVRWLTYRRWVFPARHASRLEFDAASA